MSASEPVLFELGTEELPARSIDALKDALGEALATGFRNAGLNFGAPIETFASVRRLAVRIPDVPAATAAGTEQRKGPQVSAAFDSSGEPTQALLGFARSCQADEAQLARWRAGEDCLKTEKGEWVTFDHTIEPCACVELLPEIFEAAVTDVALEKRMRWGVGEASFLRPVRWVVLLYGEQEVPGEILGVPSGRTTRGHRQLGAAQCELPSAEAYEECLRETGHVWVAGRIEEVRRQIDQLPLNGAEVQCSETRLMIGCASAEYPVVLCGEIEAEDMNLPPEVIRTVLEEQQGYFPTAASDGALSAQFVMVANQPDPEGAIAAGAARVVRARLRDAAFYLERDRQRRLDEWVADLARVTYHRKLGTLLERVSRLESLVAQVAELLDVEPDLARRAARLCKADLGTDLVQSFPSLQGIAGARYAREGGEEEAVCCAIREHYLPRRADDDLPNSAAGSALALADRLDMLAGVFCVQDVPTGARDPLGVRRAAYGVLRLLVERDLDLDLKPLVAAAVAGQPAALHRAEAADETLQYLSDRMRGYCVEQGQDKDTIEAVLAICSSRPLEALQRMRAIMQMKGRPQMTPLSETHKRIRNILREAEEVSGDVQQDGLIEESEQVLARCLKESENQIQEDCAQGRFEAALEQLLELAAPVAEFFDRVLVMAEEEQIRHNRLRLLCQVHEVFLRVADFSRLQI